MDGYLRAELEADPDAEVDTEVDAERDRRAAWWAGGLAGIAGLLVFLVIHHLWILPIWFIAPAGAAIAIVGGVLVGNAYADLRPGLPGRPWTAPALAGLVGAILLPGFLIAEAAGPMFRMGAASGDAVLLVPGGVALLSFLGLLVSAALAGSALGWLIGRTRRAAVATGVAAVAFAIGPGHNIPFLGATPAVVTEIVLVGSVVLVSSVVLVEVHARLVRPAPIRPTLDRSS